MHTRRRAGVVVIAIVAFLSLGFSNAATPRSITFTGHGWGHGRGMGQWGAYGYAVDRGYTWRHILDHYYGGSRLSKLRTNPVLRVLMRANHGRDLIVYQELGHIVTSAGAPAGGTRAVRIARLDDGQFAYYDGATCSGPWRRHATVRAAELIVAPQVRTENRAEMLQLCEANGQRRVRGSLIAVHANATIETVNRIDTDNELRSVIAREMSPSWAGAGGGRGFHALAAQAVAARSYVSAGDTRWGTFANTCDTVYCQSYGGVGYRANHSSFWSVYEDPRTDVAVALTALYVRRLPSGHVAATEFAASSGGWTKGPVFTPVSDSADGTRGNPNHNWSVTIAASTIESAFDRRERRDVGTLQGIDVLARDGHGGDGGRPTSVRARFTGGTVLLSGVGLQSTLGLKSDWFTPTSN